MRCSCSHIELSYAGGSTQRANAAGGFPHLIVPHSTVRMSIGDSFSVVGLVETCLFFVWLASRSLFYFSLGAHGGPCGLFFTSILDILNFEK